MLTADWLIHVRFDMQLKRTWHGMCVSEEESRWSLLAVCSIAGRSACHWSSAAASTTTHPRRSTTLGASCTASGLSATRTNRRPASTTIGSTSAVRRLHHSHGYHNCKYCSKCPKAVRICTTISRLFSETSKSQFVIERFAKSRNRIKVPDVGRNLISHKFA